MISPVLTYFSSVNFFSCYCEHVLLSGDVYISKYWVTAEAGLNRNTGDAKEAIFTFQGFYFRVFLDCLNPLLPLQHNTRFQRPEFFFSRRNPAVYSQTPCLFAKWNNQLCSEVSISKTVTETYPIGSLVPQGFHRSFPDPVPLLHSLRLCFQLWHLILPESLPSLHF